jgi:hypothetical protein
MLTKMIGGNRSIKRPRGRDASLPNLDVYRCAVARGSALECAAVLDAAAALGISARPATEADALLVRIVSMLTKMIG